MPSATILFSPRFPRRAAQAVPGRRPTPIVARTSITGAWSLPALPDGEYIVTAAAPGTKPAEHALRVEGLSAAKPLALDIDLERGGHTIRGRVRTLLDEPVADAIVVLSSRESGDVTVATRTDDRGRFAVGTHRRGVRVEDALVFAPGLADRDRPIPARHDGRTFLDLQLEAGGSISGVVTDADDQPSPGGLVIAKRVTRFPATPPDFGDRGDVIAATDDGGAFSLSGLRAGQWQLQALSPNATTVAPAIVRLGLGGDRTGVELRTRPSHTLRGRVTSTERAADDLPPIAVRSPERGRFVVSTRPAQDGSFEVWGLTPGRYRWDPLDPGAPDDRERHVEVTGDVVDLVADLDRWKGPFPIRMPGRVLGGVVGSVPPPPPPPLPLPGTTGATITGAVEYTAAPPPGVFAAAFSGASEIPILEAVAEIDADGRFALTGLDAGAFTLVFADSHGPLPAVAEDGESFVWLPPPIPVAADANVDAEVTRLASLGGTIRGQVRGPSGAPRPGVYVRAMLSEREVFGLHATLAHRAFRAVSGADGRFELDGIRGGDHQLVANDPVTRDNAVIESAQAGDGVFLELSRGTTVRGTVMLEGKPYVGLVTVYVDLVHPWTFDVDDGRFEVPAVQDKEPVVVVLTPDGVTGEILSAVDGVAEGRFELTPWDAPEHRGTWLPHARVDDDGP